MTTHISNFSLKKYVGGISQTAETEIATKNIKPGQELEVYINAFEESLVETQRLKENVRERITNLQSSLFQEDGGLARDSIRLLTAFEREFSLFATLEKRFDQVGNVAIRAGQQLERLGQEKKRAMAAHEIVQAFVEFCEAPEASAAKLETAVLAGSPESRTAAVLKLKRLVSLATSLGDGANPAATGSIMGLAQKVENILLEHFHLSFDSGDMSAMKQAASLLVAFNGGSSCIGSFVNQHEFFLSPVTPDMVTTKYRATGTRVDFSEPEEVDPAIKAIFNQIVTTTEEDWKYMQEVFDEPAAVMDALLTRILQEPVQVYLEESLKQAKGHCLQAHLRCLSASVKAARGLATDLRCIYERLCVDNRSRLDVLVLEPLSPYLEPSKLLEIELVALNEILSIALSPLANLLKVKRSQSKSVASFLLGTSKESHVTKINVMETLKALQMAQEYLFSGGVSLLNGYQERLIPSLEIVRRCLVVHAEGISRAFTLLPENETGPALERLFESLLTTLCSDCLMAPLDFVIELGEFGTDNKSGFDKEHLELAATGTAILSELQLYFQTSLLPILVIASPNAYRHSVQLKSAMFGKVAEKINQLLRKEVDGCMTHVKEVLLAGQRRSDFKPKTDDDLAALAGSSQTCQTVNKFLKLVIMETMGVLQADNARLFLQELGAGLNSLLIEHIQNFTISETGALLLRNDLRSYRELVAGMGPAGKAILPSFDILCEIGNIFLMRPDNLRSYLQEGLLAQLDARFTVKFVGLRADFKASGLDKLFPELDGPGTLSSFFALTSADL